MLFISLVFSCALNIEKPEGERILEVIFRELERLKNHFGRDLQIELFLKRLIGNEKSLLLERSVEAPRDSLCGLPLMLSNLQPAQTWKGDKTSFSGKMITGVQRRYMLKNKTHSFI